MLLACGLASQSLADPVAPPSADASWAVLEGCLDDPRLEPGSDQDFRQKWPRVQQCGEAAREIVRTGTDADGERLWSVFDELPEGSPIAADVLDAFLDRHMERDLAVLEGSAAPATSDRPGVALEIPDFLRDAPAELQQAWRVYQTVVEARQNTRDRRSADDTIAFQSNQPAFRRTVADLLRGRVTAAEGVRELSRYEWGGWCGTGSFMLTVPQSKALLIAHLQLGQVELALAASEGLDLSFLGAERQTARWDRRLLAAAGIDWEGFYLGGVLSGQADLANTLARHGSERAARHLLAAAHVVEAAAEEEWNTSDSLLWPLAAVVESSGSCTGYGTSDSREVHRDPEAAPVGGAIQEDVLDLLAEKVGPDAGLDEAETASHLLVQLCRPESRPTFRAMLRSPYDEVRNRGAIGLRALGETVAYPRPSRPVAFRVVVDGKPAAQRKVEWTLRTGEGNEESSSADSDVEGVVRLSRDRFLDPRRRVTSVRLSAPDLASASDVWFAASLDPPADLDAVSTVSVRTGSLTVDIPRSLLVGAEGRPPALQLVAETARYGVDAMPLPVSGNLPVVSARVTFRHLQHGRYQVWLHRGARLHTSSTVEVNVRPARLTVSERSVEEELAGYLPPDQ
jgi:hypothetical protein